MSGCALRTLSDYFLKHFFFLRPQQVVDLNLKVRCPPLLALFFQKPFSPFTCSMRIIAAYLLAVLGGNSSPSTEDIKCVFS